MAYGQSLKQTNKQKDQNTQKCEKLELNRSDIFNFNTPLQGKRNHGRHGRHKIFWPSDAVDARAFFGQ